MADFSFVDGNVPTAAQWNSNVRDQLCVICTSSTRPASPVTGRLIFETDTSKQFRYDGSAWVEVGKLGAWTTYTPTWTAASVNPAIGNGTLTGRYQRLFGRTFLVQVKMVAGSTTTFGTGAWSFLLPASLTAQGLGWGAGYAYMASTWPVLARASGTTILAKVPNGTSDTRLIDATASAPAAWANTHELVFSLIVESNA